jgi:hypothetical protein
MISLDEQDFFVWRGPNRLELSDMGHEAAVILHEGHYFLFTSNDTQAISTDVLHLACQEGRLYRIHILPQGLPSKTNRIVDITTSQEMLTLDSITT